MSTVTPKINLTKPAGIEQYSLPLLNANFDKVDAAMPIITLANSTYNAGQANFTSSTFLRLSVGTSGFIVANITGQFNSSYSVDVPANTAAPVNFNSAIIPANMRPKSQVGLVTGAVFSNEARGDNLQILMAPDGTMGIRSQGAAFTRASSGSLVMRWAITYEWNGSEV